MKNKANATPKFKAWLEADKAWNEAWEALKETSEYKTYDEARKKAEKALAEVREELNNGK